MESGNAKISVNYQRLRRLDDGRAVIDVSIQNVGNGPGVITGVHLEAGLRQHAACPSFQGKDVAFPLAAHANLHSDFPVAENPSLDDINRGRKTIYTYGHIRYLDTFNRVRNNRTCRIYRPEREVTAGFALCTTCNESD